jgi:HD-GYP domain-containing protein (c-di-GMP phosphodiesterase class II)
VQDIREGSDLDVTKAKKVLVGMVDSMVRNPDALLLLTRLKDKDSYTYGHAIDVSIYMLAFGRHLGFPKDQLNNLGMGGMLLDIGKMQLPQALLEKRGKLTATEFEMVKRHVEFGIETLQKTKNIPGMVMEIVASHHERQDGSGYPLGLDKSKIGMFGSMGAIVDCYDALVSDRPYASPLTSYDALQSLYAWKGKYFHEHLVEQFIQCLGIYPVGSLVELNTGEVGVVIAQNRVRRMKPRIMLILDSDKKPYKFPNMLDLLLEPKAVGDQPYQIKRALEAGMYGIDPKEYYL